MAFLGGVNQCEIFGFDGVGGGVGTVHGTASQVISDIVGNCHPGDLVSCILLGIHRGQLIQHIAVMIGPLQAIAGCCFRQGHTLQQVDRRSGLTGDGLLQLRAIFTQQSHSNHLGCPLGIEGNLDGADCEGVNITGLVSCTGAVGLSVPLGCLITGVGKAGKFGQIELVLGIISH